MTVYQSNTLTELETGFGSVVVFCRGLGDANEDAAAVWVVDNALFIAVADGLGGSPRGEVASRTALTTLSAHRGSVESGVEAANQAVHQLRGPACTLVVAQVVGVQLTTLHAGDSQAMVVGGRGKLKLVTTPHTVAGLGERAGLLDEEEAETHPERHIVTNCLGDKVIRIERTTWGTLAARDTVLLASDGLFDNVPVDEVARMVCAGSLSERVSELATHTLSRMDEGKPDDLTIVAWRGQH